MKTSNSWAVGMALAASALFVAPAQANLVNNGSFETRDFTGWTETGPIDDRIFNGVQCPGADPSVVAGECSAYFGSFGTTGIQQVVNVGAPGGIWNLSFSLMPSGATGSSFSVLFGGQTLLSLTSPAMGDYTTYRFGGLTTASNMTLAFNFQDPVGFLFLDNVTLAVPEPGTMGLLGAGIAGLLLSTRRRKTV